jgi:hypothetical protein
VLITAAFLVLLFSGVILFVSPPGRIANWTNWSILTLTKKDWIGLHICFSMLFLLVTIFHLVFNWRLLLNYFKDRMTQRLGFRWEWPVALAICGCVYAGTRAGVPPFSTLLAFNDRVKESWEQPRERAPIPHAELLTLAELTQKAGVDMAAATNRLQAKGITGFSPDIVVQELAEKNRHSAQQLYAIILAEPAKSEAGQGRGQGQGRGGFGGGGGVGVGWKTLTQFCSDENIELKDTLARLQSKGIKATAKQTMREIAVNNGYNRPYELIEILRAK